MKRALMIAGAHLPAEVVALRDALKAEAGRSKGASRFQAAKKENVLEMFIYGQIGQSWYDDGVGAADVAQSLKEAGKVDRIALRINSPGGSVFEGAAIFTQLKAAGVPIDVRVDGLAASAAFTIAMAGDTIEVGEAAMMMLHNAWGISMGEADEMRREADLLDKISLQMAGIYASRSAQTVEDVTAMMKAETWLGPQDAIDKGFANAIVKSAPKQSARAMAAKFDLTMFARHVPDALKVEAGEAEAELEPSANPADAEGAIPQAADVTPDLSMYERRLRLAGHNL
jgi:ATP-dependent Clp protease protease subunit